MIRFLDSFSHYASGDVAEKYTDGQGQGNIVVGSGRLAGNNAMQFGSEAGGPYLRTLSNDVATTITMGVAVQFGSLTPGNGAFMGFADTGHGQVGVDITNAGAVTALADTTHFSDQWTTVLGTSANDVIQSTNQWYYVELQAVIHPTAGSVVIRVDGVEVLSLSNVNTSPTGNAYANQVGFFPGSASLYSDFYCTDDQGGVNTSFLGDISVVLGKVDANGRITAFAPSPSSNANWQNVDDTTPDGDSSYNASANVGDVDAYQVGPISNVDLVLGLQVVASVRKDNSGTRQAQVGIGNGTTENYGTEFTLPSTYIMECVQYDKNPFTGESFTAADLTTLQLAVLVAA